MSNAVRLELRRFLMPSEHLLLILDLISIPEQRSFAIER
jgi:hypothetical protein